MAKFVVEFSPPEKIKLEPEHFSDSVVNYCMVLAPFQKQTQVEFNNIKLKQTAVRFLTVINPLDKPGQFVLPSPSDGVYFNVYEFSLEPKSQCELSITWQPSEYGNMRKLIKIEQEDSNKKYDFVILGNCNGSPFKKSKGAISTHSKLKNSNLSKKQFNCGQKKVSPNKKKTVDYKTEKITEPVDTEIIRRQTYLVGEKENCPAVNKNILGRDTILSSPKHESKRPNQRRHDYVFNKDFNSKNLNRSSSPFSDGFLEETLKKCNTNNSQFNDFCLTPLKCTENFNSPFNVKNEFDNCNGSLSFDCTDGPFALTSTNSFSFKIEDSSFVLPEYPKSTEISLNLYNKFTKSENEHIKDNIHFESSTIYSESLVSSPEDDQSSVSSQKSTWITTAIAWSGSKPKRPSFAIKNSPYYKYSPKTSKMSKNKLKQCSISPKESRLRPPTQLDKYDQHLKDLANPLLWYHNNAEDPFLNMSEFYEAEWLNRQESDMIRWLNALLTPTDKLADDEHSNDLEKAAMAWVEASKTSHKNKPMQLATEKDLFVAQIYRQSPQQWSALRKATTNLITSTSVTSVLSKLTMSIEKDLITVRDDRQIHLDLSLKKKVIDLFKCYNPLWFRIGLEAIYGQIVKVKPGSNDLDGVGWFVRKHLFNNDYVKQKFTKTTVLQVNLPSYNAAMKKFILRKILMLIYFLDRAKEQQLIRHNPCLFKTNSPFKSSYDLLMGFCADMVTAHGDIVRRLRNIGYNLTHKQMHVDEVNYAVKSLNDLRDGTRITRVVEILFKGSPLSQKLRLPAISILQKIHNVNLAFTRISQHISIEGNISTRDIVNGHREKILSLFWQIIYKYLTPRYNNAAAKIQNWWRNSSLKLVVLKRIRAKQVAKRHFAATKIQACVRGYLIRKQWPHMQVKLIKNREMLHMASTTIKLYLKDKLKLLTDERKRFIILRRTVVYVQRKFRAKMVMVKEREKYLKAKRSVVIIQKVFRGYVLRKNLLQIKNNLIVEKVQRITAVNTIKHALRKNLPLTEDREKFLKLKQTVLFIENLYVANKLMKLEIERYTTVKNNVVFIQRKLKANIIMKKERKNYLKTKQSAIIIQKIFRGFMVKKYWSIMQIQLLSEKKKRIEAINVIKRVLRQNLPKTADHLTFLKLKHNVLFVEELYIANKSMKMQMERYITLKNMTVFVQQKFRATIAMRKTQKNYLKIKQSAILIQKIFRGFMVRKHWSDMQINLLSEKNKRINAISIIIRTLRKNLPKTQVHKNFLKLKNSVIFIQQMWRANCSMKIQLKQYSNLRYTAIFVQRKYRAKILMRTDRYKYLKIQHSVLLIQRVYRGFAVRKNWLNIKNHLMMIKTKRIQSINVIKYFLRKNLPPTQDELYYKKLKRSTLIIQRRFRANVAMRKQSEKFQMLKSSAIILQQRFRAKQAMDTARKRYTNLKICTVQLQSVIRGYLTRKQWPELQVQLQIHRTHLICCVNIIQKALRRNLPLTKDRIRFLELKKSVTVIQQRLRANNESIRQRAKYLRLKSTLLKLQSVARGYLFRQYMWPTFRNSLLETRSRLEQCSNVIKRCLWRCLPVTEDRKMFLRLKAATIVIQRRCRANQVMRYQSCEYIKIRMATIMLQSVARGYLYRKLYWPALKTELIVHRQLLIQCANTIKRVLRKHLANNDRHQFLMLRNAAVIIQRKFQARRQALKYRKLCVTVLMVQQRFRANVTAKLQWTEYNRTRSMVILLQAYARGYLVRCQWPKTRLALLIHRNQLITASNTIKRFLRQCLPTTPERSDYLKLRWAAVVVQTRYRAIVLATLVQAKYLQLRQCTIIIQRHYRARRAIHAAIVLQTHIRGYLTRKQWPQLKDRLETERELVIETLRVNNNAASIIQATVRGFLTRKRFPEVKNRLQTEKQVHAAILIQTFWRGFCVRKNYKCRRQTVGIPKKGAPTLARIYNNVMDVLIKQKKNKFSYKELATVFWNLDTCTSLSKELCIKTAKGNIMDYIFNFLQYSNQSQPCIEAREPAIRALTNLLRCHETSWIIWTRVLNANMFKELIKIMKSCCGKFGASKKLYCSIATWIWIALQDPQKKLFIKNSPVAIFDLMYMKDMLNRRYKTYKVDKKVMILPSTRPTWSIGSKCQKCFLCDVYAITQVCKMLEK